MDFIKNGTHGNYRIPVGAVLYILTSATSTARATCNKSGQGPWVSNGATTACGPFTEIVEITVECIAGDAGVDVGAPVGNNNGGGTATLNLQPYDAANNLPPIVSSTEPAAGDNFIVSNAGITVLPTPIDGITAVRQGDQLSWVAALGKIIRYTDSYAAPVQMAASFTLNDGYADLVVNLSSNPTVTLNTGLSPGFNATLLGAFTWAGTATRVDQRQPAASGTTPVCFIINDAADHYILEGSV